MNKTLLRLLPALLAAGLAGCSRQGNYTDSSAINSYGTHHGDESSDTTRAYQTQQLYGTVVHDNSQLYYNQILSDQLSNMYGIRTAIVMTTDKYAYVAVMLDQSGVGTYGGGASEQTNNSGAFRGLYNPADPHNDGAAPNQIAGIPNSYVTVHNHHNVSRGVKQKIAQKIRYLQPSVMDVFISADADFINSMTNFAHKSWTDQPLHPHVDDFNQIVTNTFGNGQMIRD